MRKIFFDIETKNTFEEVGSTESSALDMSVVCIYDTAVGDFESFMEADLPKLWPKMEAADAIIGFNSDHFDIPILNKYYAGDLTKIKSIDLMKEVKKSLGRRIKLDTLAEATLGKNKSGHGLDAIIWWQNGEIDKIIKYCIEDVRITKELYDYMLKNRSVKYKDAGQIKEISIDSNTWEIMDNQNAVTFTLPF